MCNVIMYVANVATYLDIVDWETFMGESFAVTKFSGLNFDVRMMVA